MKNSTLFFSFVLICCYTAAFAQCDNVALLNPVTASGVYLSNTPAKAVNGNCGDMWNSGNHAPQSIEVDLLSNYTINNINVMFSMSPNGNVNHEILTSPDMVTWTVVDVITGYYVTGQLIERCYSNSPLTNVRGIRVNSISSPSWIAIMELGAYTLSTPTNPTITASGPLTFCQGGAVTLTSSAALTYLWSNGATTQSITVNSSGVYSVSTNQIPSCVQGSLPCTTCGLGTASATVTVNPLPVIVADAGPDASICSGGNTILQASGGSSYLWNTNATTSSITVNPLVTTTYYVTVSVPLTSCSALPSTDSVKVTINPKPTVNIIGAVNPLCDSTKLNWASWSSVNGTTGSGTISSNLSVVVSKPTGGLSTTGGMYNGGVFPPQFSVPANSTAIRNDLAGLFTFCFNVPVLNPQIAMSSIGNPGNSVQVNTSDPYQIIWFGQGMTYPNNTTFIGTEGYTIIQFPGLHTCISFDYLQSETYCNLAFGTLDTNCQSVNTPPLCGGSADTLTATGASSYSWIPSTGLNTSSGSVVIASPLVTTKYYVIGTDANNCSGMDSILVEVLPLPGVTLTGDTVICAGDSTILTVSGGGTYLWKPGNSTNSSISVSPAATAAYTAVVTGAGGCTDSSTITVIVKPLPQALFNLTPVCKNEPVVYNDASTGNISSWNWNYGDGTTSALQNSTYTYTTCDTFNVKLLVTTIDGCIDSISNTAIVYCLPVAGFSSTDVCLNELMNFVDLSSVSVGTISGWSWDFDDGNSLSSVQNANHTYTNAGSYDVSLITTSINGCKDTVIKNVAVHPLPAAKLSTANVCDGTPVSFTDLSTISAPDLIQTWTLDFDDGSPPDNNPNTSHLYSAIGFYDVQLLIVSDFGCQDSIIKKIEVNPNPNVLFAANDTTGCDPLCLSFSDLSSVASGSNVQWSWNVGDGSTTSSSQNFDHCYASLSVNSPDYFTVSLTVTSDSGCVSSLVKNNYITVYPNPTADFSVQPMQTTITDPLISIVNTSTGADLWNWNLGDGSAPISTSLQFSHTYADTGTYTITLITSTQYGCSDSASQTIIIEPDFVFYIPNAFSPNNDPQNSTFSGKGVFIKEYEMVIFDRWGNLIYKTNDINLPWNGKYNSKDAVQDTYVYSFRITDFRNDVHYYRGTVSLIR